ncbi:MAG TPA: tail fiber domain-containing protein [Vicinamibacterales bacterium]|nr:tail fiber domain-containing protein [Vicinamibacterales bacterium]
MGGITDVLDPIDALHGGDNPNPLADPLDLFGDRAGDAANNAANAQLQASRDQIAFLQSLYNAQQGNNAYATGIGNQALGLQAQFFGLTPGVNPGGSYTFGPDGKLVNTPGTTAPAAGAPNFNALMMTPDYQFTLGEGNRALGQNQAARGNLFSGGAGRELADYNQGLASTQIGNVWNRLSGLSGAGQAATQSTNNALSGIGGQIGNSLLGQGDSRASGYLGAYQGQQQGLSNALSLGGLALAFSDRRLKSNIKRIGTKHGLPWYSYDIFGKPSEGVMADEAMKVRPGAVSRHPSGYLVVNYGAL